VPPIFALKWFPNIIPSTGETFHNLSLYLPATIPFLKSPQLLFIPTTNERIPLWVLPVPTIKEP
jgi:hypothetical protein